MPLLRNGLLLLCLLVAGSARAQATLPYTGRTLSLSGMGTTVNGDLRTVGMGGASAGLADTFIAAIQDPAGLAMTAGIGDIHFTSNQFQDGNVQSLREALTIQSFGLALGLYPWAVSAGYLQPYNEAGTYEPRSSLLERETSVRLSVVTRELVLSAARVLFNNRLSLGVSLVLGQAERAIEAPAQLGGDRNFHSYTGGATVGTMVQLPKRVLLGLSFASPLHYAGDSHPPTNLAVPGFFQPVEVPWRVTFGVGWVPSRFFRADFTLHVLTATPSTALIRDEAALVGQRVTAQPHLGLAYVFADHKEFKATLFLGGYYELSRIAGAIDRMHGTGGVEARVWILTFGGGLDFASAYKSFILSAGVDVFGLLARIGVIPKFGTPPSGKLFPKPWGFDETGLARPLQAHYTDEGSIDPIKTALAIPKNLPQGAKNAIVELKEIGHEIKVTLETPTQRAKREEAERQAEAAKQAKIAEELWAKEIARAAEDTRLEQEKKLERLRAHRRKRKKAATNPR